MKPRFNFRPSDPSSLRFSGVRRGHYLPILLTFSCGAVLGSDLLVSWDIPLNASSPAAGSTQGTSFPGLGVTAATGMTLTGSVGGATTSFGWRWYDGNVPLGTAPPADFQTAFDNNNFFSYNITASNIYNLSIDGLGETKFRIGGSAPNHLALLYSATGTWGAGEYRVISASVEIPAGTTATDLGPALAGDLSSSPISLSAGASGYFRMVYWGATSTGSGAIWIGDTSLTNDFSLLGTATPTVVSHNLLWTGAGGSNWNTTASNKNWADTDLGNAAAAFVTYDSVTINSAASIEVAAGGVSPSAMSVGNDSGIVSLSGASITGASLTKTGGGTLVLGTANEFTGGVSISGGIVEANSNVALGTATVSIDGATLKTGSGTSLVSNNLVVGNIPVTVETADNVEFSGVVAIAGAPVNVANLLTKTGTGVLTFSNSGSSAIGSQSFYDTVGGTMELDISAGGVDFLGGGTRNLGGSNNWDGPVTLGGGVVQLHGGEVTGSGVLTLTANSTIRSRLNYKTATLSNRISVPSGITLNLDSANGDNLLLVTSEISGDGMVKKIGNGEVRLANANVYTGGTSASAGKLSITNLDALSSGAVDISGGQLLVEQLSGTLANDLTVVGTTAGIGATGKGAVVYHADSGTLSLSGVVTLSGDAALRSYSSGSIMEFDQAITGSGILTLEAGGAATVHNQVWKLQGGPSTFFGDVNLRSDGSANAYLLLDGGSLPAGSILTLEDGSTVGGNDAVFDLNGSDQTLYGLNRIEAAGGLGSFVTNGGATPCILTIDGDLDSSFSGVIGVNTASAATGQTGGGNGIALVKKGIGIMAMTGANTYSGNTTVLGGTLSFTATNFSDASTVTLNGGKLHLDGGTDVVAALIINGVTQPGEGAIYTKTHSSGAITGDGAIQVGSSGASGYSTWVSGSPYNLTGNDALPGADPDHDGIANSVEFVIGGNPATVSNVNMLPTSTISGSDLVFTYRLSDISAYLNPTIQYGSDLTGWITAENGVGGVTIGAPTDLGGGVKQVVVTIPKGVSAKLFARLNVVVTP